MESPHAATRQTAQTPLAANAARPLDLIDASPVPLVAAASAGGGKTHLSAGRDEQTIELAKQLDQLQRRGVDAKQFLEPAAARKLFLTNHATAALAYRRWELVRPKRSRRPVSPVQPFERSSLWL
jgi:hypothetical protein